MVHKLARARGRLRRHLGSGWARVVFAAPQSSDGDGSESDPEQVEVIEGPGLGDPDDAQFAALRDAAFASTMQAAALAAEAGRVKHTWVLDPARQLRVDARHGHVKLRERDEESLRKTMGGKQRSLRPDTSADLLRAIGIMNADGSISARNAKKYKQVNHLVELCRPVWEHVLAARADGDDAGGLRVLDLACGNSYLDFVLAHALALEHVAVTIVGIDVRADVIERSRARAAALGLSEAMRFLVGTIAQAGEQAIAQLGGAPEIAIALHACDTATDEALALSIERGARAILAAPCCQAELARQLAPSGPDLADRPGPDAHGAGGAHGPGGADEAHGDGADGALLRHGLLRRAYADALTDALRVDMLQACGYAVTVVEFVDSEHTAKNLLIRALLRDRGAPSDRSARAQALAEVARRCAKLGVRPTLLRLLAPEISV